VLEQVDAGKRNPLETPLIENQQYFQKTPLPGAVGNQWVEVENQLPGAVETLVGVVGNPFVEEQIPAAAEDIQWAATEDRRQNLVG